MKKGDYDEGGREKLLSAIHELLSYAESRYGISGNEIIKGGEGPSIPISVFSGKLSGLTSSVKYLRENLNLGNSEIAELLNRSGKTIWAAYNSGRKEKRIFPETGGLMIPVFALKKERLSILESIVGFLKKKGLRNNEIAALLKKDQRTVWTVCSRIREKEGKNAKK